MKYWKEAESTNGRLAMIGLFAAVVNYGFTGWIIPGIFRPNRSLSILPLLNLRTMTNKTQVKTIEKEKVIAEVLNGRFAMVGIIAGLGAYLTTGQIIPGFV